MLKNILNLEGVKSLSKSQQKTIVGGIGDGGGGGNPYQGNYSLKCNSGIWIPNCPDHSSTTGDFACENQSGYSGTWICVGTGC